MFVIFVRLKTPMWLTWLTMQMMVHVQPFKMQTYVCCTTIVRSKYNSNCHRILWAAISLQQKPNVTFICLTLNHFWITLFRPAISHRNQLYTHGHQIRTARCDWGLGCPCLLGYSIKRIAVFASFGCLGSVGQEIF